MRRLSILGFFVSIMIACCTISSAQATSLPSKTDLESAISRINEFTRYAQSYVSVDQYPQEYEYLTSLSDKTNILVDKYNDSDFVNQNTEAYNTAIPAIDQAIEGCRYIFGIVRAETLAKQAADQAANATNAVPNSNANTTTYTQAAHTQSTPTIISNASTTAISPETTEGHDSNSNIINTTDATPEITEAPQENETSVNLPTEIPKTGENTQSLSMPFIVLISFIAATIATSIYFIHNRPTKHHNPTAHHKRR